VGQEVMIEDLTQSFEDSELKKKEAEEEEAKPDPLTQLVTTFCRGAMTERSGALQVFINGNFIRFIFLTYLSM
jgi:ryanodine receptor 2